MTKNKSAGPSPISSEDRKDAHLRICLEEPIERLGVTTGFEHLRFEHDALPEIARDDIDLSTTLFGKRLAAPIMIGAMTGGTPWAGEINRILARAAQECGVAMALGSQRKMLEAPKVAETFAVRDVAPDILLMGNVGAVQLNYGVGLSEVERLIGGVGCDMFAFHLNALQEAIQPEGDTDFSGLIGKLEELVPQVSVPVIFKEVGSGLSRKTLKKIAGIQFAGLETAGVGGTSWSKIETYRTDSWIQQMTGRRLGDWGVPTAASLKAAVDVYGSDRVIICSGGIRTGLQMAKAVAMGAHLVASALPFLKAAHDGGYEAVVMTIRQFIDELRTVCFVTGSKDLKALRAQTLLEVTG